MNRIRFWGGIPLLTLMLSSCGDDALISSSTAQGSLMLNVKVDSQIASSTIITGSRAEDGGTEAWDVTTADLTLAVTSKANNGTIYYNLGTFDSNQVFPVGQYDISVYYGDKDNEGFGNPHYYGIAKNVEIKKDAVTPVNITAELQNAMVKITYTDALKDYLTSCLADIKSENGKEKIEYPLTENRYVYMQPGKITVGLNLTKPNGVEAYEKIAEISAEAKHFYGIKLDITGSDIVEGSSSLAITFDDNLEEGETVEFSLADEALTAPAPTISVEGFEAATPIVHSEGMVYSDPLTMQIYAPGIIKSAVLQTTHADRIDGWPESIDLVVATSAQKESLTNAGLKVIGLWKNPDQLAQIDFASVLQHIALASPTTNVNMAFTLIVTDNNGKSSEPAELNVTVKPFEVKLSISDPSKTALELGETSMSLSVSYNGLYIDQNIKIQYNDEYGTWKNATAAFTATETKDLYTANISDLPTSGGFQLRAIYNDTDASNELSISRNYPAITLSIDEKDVWAKEATFTVKATDGPSVLSLAAATVGAWISTNGTTYSNYNDKTISGDQITLNNLSPNTTYYVKVTLSGNMADLSDAISFTTEETLQLTNGDMETWYQSDKGSYWTLLYPGASADESLWGTNNPMTTSQGVNTAYCRISGTISTTDSHSGSYAALIRTVGWGSGNTATGLVSTGVVKYVDAGLLHFGSSRSKRLSEYSDREGCLTTGDLNCGKAFASRPLSISFYYKYSPKNSDDQGVAEITIMDASGNTIATDTKLLPAQSSYTQETLTLTYPQNAPKAAKIYVKFLSTNDRSFLSKTSDNLSAPGWGSSSGAYIGSQLYIDDITLNY